MSVMAFFWRGSMEGRAKTASSEFAARRYVRTYLQNISGCCCVVPEDVNLWSGFDLF